MDKVYIFREEIVGRSGERELFSNKVDNIE